MALEFHRLHVGDCVVLRPTKFIIEICRQPGNYRLGHELTPGVNSVALLIDKAWSAFDHGNRFTFYTSGKFLTVGSVEFDAEQV